MPNQYKQYSRSYYPYSKLTLSCLVTFIIFIQAPMIIVAQANQYQSVIASNNNNNNARSSSTAINTDEAYPDGASDIYDDTEDFEEIPSPPVTSPVAQLKFTPNITSNRPVQPEEAENNEYEDEPDSYQNYLNEDTIDDETTKQDGSQLFSDTISMNPLEIKPPIIDSNNKKNLDQSSTSRMPFVPANLWRELFSRPGILVGIIGGIVIGMLSAILLVMFIIYRMRKKDEGSYALEEGPRKSPSHAYTRVSSREFFA
ncbi:unnamed protein product [Rotaria socialis]|uniref:Syndecan n=1 Tax=Rotaria socialis TaxID=392032 RepID=A0A820J3J3_9BILA|nr:unnamed protein product [Rotaria socialis]CAF3397979.1 unnamed protein product [Rotaria socialis]CAF3508321.1 unnamed protein product [Rotaria socialis]CAF3697178.1 unnamed protein product [Rotaria socialis]CAF3759550.1 unnamed protein product [Rotaria socialis]